LRGALPPGGGSARVPRAGTEWQRREESFKQACNMPANCLRLRRCQGGGLVLILWHAGGSGRGTPELAGLRGFSCTECAFWELGKVWREGGVDLCFRTSAGGIALTQRFGGLV